MRQGSNWARGTQIAIEPHFETVSARAHDPSFAEKAGGWLVDLSATRLRGARGDEGSSSKSCSFLPCRQPPVLEDHFLVQALPGPEDKNPS
jgi:hypothetical protein